MTLKVSTEECKKKINELDLVKEDQHLLIQERNERENLKKGIYGVCLKRIDLLETMI